MYALTHIGCIGLRGNRIARFVAIILAIIFVYTYMTEYMSGLNVAERLIAINQIASPWQYYWGGIGIATHT